MYKGGQGGGGGGAEGGEVGMIAQRENLKPRGEEHGFKLLS